MITELRAFEISTDGAATAVVEIFAKILDDRNGTVRKQQAFRAVVPVRGAGNPAFVAALDAAFARVAAVSSAGAQLYLREVLQELSPLSRLDNLYLIRYVSYD